MKKRALSILTAAAMLLTLLPTAALAEEISQEQCSCVSLCTEGNVSPDCPVCGVEGAELSTVCKPTTPPPEPDPAPEPTVQTVTDWSWVDESGALSGNTLTVHNQGGDAPAWAVVASWLPTEITATVAEVSDPVKLALGEWTCEGYNPAAPGSYAAVTTLADDTYTLGADAAPLTLTVELPAPAGGGANLLEDADTGDFTVTGGTLGEDYTYIDHTLTILTGAALTLSGNTTADKIVVAEDAAANVTLNGVSVLFENGNNKGPATVATETAAIADGVAGTTAFALGSGSKVTLTLEGENALKSGNGRAGVFVPGGAELTINGSGSLNATGGRDAAGIGGDSWHNAGKITITSGTVTAYSVNNGAGIGGGHANDAAAEGQHPYGQFEAITITGGTVTAISGDANSGNSAGIGCGCWARDMGAITITGGTVHAKAESKGGEAYDIGYSYGYAYGGNASGGSIAITGGVIYTEGSHNCDLGANAVSKDDMLLISSSDKIEIHGSPTLTADVVIPAGKTLTVPDGSTLTIPNGVTLTNEGTIVNAGTLTNDGTIKNASAIEGTPLTGSGTATTEITAGEFTLTSDSSLTSGTDYSYESHTLTIKSGKAITISGTTTSDHIVVDGSCTGESAANITLDGVDIRFSSGCAFEVAGDAVCNLTLATGSENTLQSGYTKAGLQTQSKDGKTAVLTITDDGAGSLTASGGERGAGIGGGNSGAGGEIVIGGGTVKATGGQFGAGIGGGQYGEGGTIAISGGSVTATGGERGAGIGGSFGGAGGEIVIGGGTVKATGGQYGTGIGGTGGSITITGGKVCAAGGDDVIGSGVRGDSLMMDGPCFLSAATKDVATTTIKQGFLLADGSAMAAGDVTLPDEPAVTIAGDKALTVRNGAVLTIPEGVTLTVDGLLQNGGTVVNHGTISGSGYLTGNEIGGASLQTPGKCGDAVDIAAGDVRLYETAYAQNGVLYAWDVRENGVILYGESDQHTVTVGERQTVFATLDRLSINVSGAGKCAFDCTDANVTLTLAGENRLVSGMRQAGLQAGAGATLLIQGDGSMEAVGGAGGAGIGGGSWRDGGNITIAGGTVTAMGNENMGIGGSAGIGGGSNGSGGVITITGGIVTATGGKTEPSKGHESGAGIGGGSSYGSGGEITISGGTVTATGGNSAAGIGGGTQGDGGKIAITGGHVTAYGDSAGAAGIGGGAGYGGSGGEITISGGTVAATGGTRGAGIGGGDSDDGGAITITGGSVTAIGASGGAGLGGGSNGSGGTFSTAKGLAPGNAFIVSSSISDQSGRENWSGVIFQGDSGVVYGSPTLSADGEIPAGKTLIVPPGSTLTIGESAILNNIGTVKNCGSIVGTITGPGKVLSAIEVGDFTLASDEGLSGGADYSYEDHTLTIQSGKALTLSGSTTLDRIVVAPGVVADLTLDGVSVTFTDGHDYTDDGNDKEPYEIAEEAEAAANGVAGTTALALGDGAKVALTLHGNNTLQSGGGRAGIFVPAGAELTIGGSGSLTALGGNAAAGIGGDTWHNAGKITINSGTVTATSANDAAGIGGGHANDDALSIYGQFEAITINGGTVTATSDGHGNGAGIGCGCWAKAMGTIAITGGTIHAKSVAHDEEAYDIGFAHGYDEIQSGDRGSIAITGGVIYTEGEHGRGLGADELSKENMLLISTGSSEIEINGNPILTSDAEIPWGKTLTIPAESTLTIGEGVTLVNSGTLTKTGNLVNHGALITASRLPVSGPDGDGNRFLPTGTTIEKGGITVTIGGPYTAAKLDPAGGVTLPGGGSVTVTDGTTTTTITPPIGGGKIEIGDDGTLALPGGATVRVGGGDPVTVPPGGGTVDPITGAISYTVTFDSRGGSAVESFSVADGEKAKKPADPTKSGYTFGGWYREKVCATAWDFAADMVTAGVTLYAKWTPISSNDDDTRSNRPGAKVDGAGGTVKTGSGTVTITPDEGYRIAKITVNGKEVDIPANGKLTGLKRTDKVVVIFEKVPEKPAVDMSKYADMDAGAWYFEAVRYAVEHGLFAGTSDTTFSPDAPMTRAMLVTVLYRAAGEPSMEDEIWGYPFADVDAESWYGTAVYWARLGGITSGTGEETFSPDGFITREQLAAMLYRYAGSPATAGTLDGFTDADKAGGYAQDALKWAVEQGIITGKGNDVLDPKGNATRAEAAQMLLNFLEMAAP